MLEFFTFVILSEVDDYKCTTNAHYIMLYMDKCSCGQKLVVFAVFLKNYENESM